MELSLSVVVFLVIVLVLLVAPPLVGKINVIGTTENGNGWYLGGRSPYGASTDWLLMHASPRARIFRAALWSRSKTRPQ